MMLFTLKNKSNFLSKSLGVLTVALIILSSAQAYSDDHSKRTEALNSLPSSTEVMQQMERVANWQVPRIDYLSYVESERRRGSLAPARWVQGSFYIGLTEIAERSENPFYRKWISYKANELNWELGPVEIFADDQLIGQTYLWYYLNQDKNPKYLEPTRRAFDEILSNPPTNSLEFVEGRDERKLHACQYRWCWSDALFMAPATWLGLSEATGDKRYAEFAHQETKATIEYLFDPKYALLYRDSRFKTLKDDSETPIFWSRGSGWVFAGLARIMEFVPKNNPERAYYENVFRLMAAKLKTLQKKDGSWPMSLLAGESMPEPETSGTGFFAYGLAWGINEGLLAEEEYMPTLEKAWSVLNSAIHPDGKLGWVQQIGHAPDKVAYEDSQLYGVGAFLLAGSEIYDMQLANGN